jgi:hypothetical protein
MRFKYVVILSRTPIYAYKTWSPQGHFLEKSFSELMQELPFDDKNNINSLIIRLRGPGVAAEETMKCGEEEVETDFSDAKAGFLRMAKMSLKTHNRTNPGKTLTLNFEIEAVREKGMEEDEGDDVDLMF